MTVIQTHTHTRTMLMFIYKQYSLERIENGMCIERVLQKFIVDHDDVCDINVIVDMKIIVV